MQLFIKYVTYCYFQDMIFENILLFYLYTSLVFLKTIAIQYERCL